MTTLQELSAIDSVDVCLKGRGYSRRVIQRVRNDLWRLNELATSVELGDLRPADEAAATESYISSLPPVPYDDPSWGEDDGQWVPTPDDTILDPQTGQRFPRPDHFVGSDNMIEMPAVMGRCGSL